MNERMNNENNENKIAGIDLNILLHDFFAIARRRIAMLLLFLVLSIGAIGTWEYLSYKPSYTAQATFTIYVSNPLQSTIQSYNTATAEQMAKTFPYILTSGALSDMIKERLGISSIPPISANVLNNTNIFTMRVTSSDPKLAYDVLNAAIEYYPEIAEFVVGPTVMNLLSESGLPSRPTTP